MAALASAGGVVVVAAAARGDSGGQWGGPPNRPGDNGDVGEGACARCDSELTKREEVYVSR